MLKITFLKFHCHFIGFLETLHNNSTVKCGWPWPQVNHLRFNIFASHHKNNEQNHGFVHFTAEQAYLNNWAQHNE